MIRIYRSYPAPDSLSIESGKVNGKYNLPDVTEQLREDFHDKCYICEIKPVADPEVEHLLPHKNDTVPGRKFDWDNLFWSCGHCNRLKNQARYDKGILDCCRSDPEDRLQITVLGESVTVRSVQEDDEEAQLTAELIQEVYNCRNTGIRTAASSIRVQLVQREMIKLYGLLQQYTDRPTSRVVHEKIRALLRRESAFAQAKRDYVRSNITTYPELQKYLI